MVLIRESRYELMFKSTQSSYIMGIASVHALVADTIQNAIFTFSLI